MGCGGRTGGCVRTFYDPKLSSKGAVSAAGRAPRATTADFVRVRGAAPSSGSDSAKPVAIDDFMQWQPTAV